jgi:hypothetical protein
MASCLGADGGRKAVSGLSLAFLKIVLTCGLTSVLVIWLWSNHPSSSAILDPDRTSILLHVIVSVIVSPLCWGFHTFFRHFLPGRREQIFPILFSSVASALAAVYLLPGFILYLVVVLAGFGGHIAG